MLLLMTMPMIMSVASARREAYRHWLWKGRWIIRPSPKLGS